MEDGEDDSIMGGAPGGFFRKLESRASPTVAGPSTSMNGAKLSPMGPSLLRPYHTSTSLRDTRDANVLQSTPEIANDISGRLTLSSTSADSDESFVEDSSENEADELPSVGLPVAELPTGLCYDPRMRYHSEIRATSDVHPEDPRRIWKIYNELCQAGLVEAPESVRPLVQQPLKRIPVREGTEDEICLVHTEEHYRFVESTATKTEDELIELETSMDSIYFNTLSFLSSLYSVGGAIETCRAVVQREVKNAIAVIRPPGHHAEIERPMGFCLFNNVCVAARVCQREFGDKCRKIMILDWDVHHGNGVQKVFYKDANVLYVSIHVYQGGHFYPGGPEGDIQYCGDGAGVGRNVNIPWSDSGMGDADYLFAFQQIVMPIGHEFDPDLVIISAGFDAAAGDELGRCHVTPACYAHMTHMLMTLANGKVSVCLEGGYNLRSISKSALAVARTLMGEPPDRINENAPTRKAIDVVSRVKSHQSRYWSCLWPKKPDQSFHGERLHDIIRQHQASQLYNDYKLINLHVYHSKISKSFENQVLATSDFEEAKPLLIIFHDPPDVMGIPHPTNNRLEAHNTWLADAVKDYIGWAIEEGFAVIDVNMPCFITGTDTDVSYQDEDNTVQRNAAAEELSIYLWENYIETSDATSIFLLGIGDAFHGLVHLLKTKDQVYTRIAGVVSFNAENALRPVNSQSNVWLSKWYLGNSLVFVSHAHNAWASDRKLSKRYGKLTRSPKDWLNEMLVHHQPQVEEWLRKRAMIKAESDDSEVAGNGTVAKVYAGGASNI